MRANPYVWIAEGVLFDIATQLVYAYIAFSRGYWRSKHDEPQFFKRLMKKEIQLHSYFNILFYCFFEEEPWWKSTEGKAR